MIRCWSRLISLTASLILMSAVVAQSPTEPPRRDGPPEELNSENHGRNGPARGRNSGGAGRKARPDETPGEGSQPAGRVPKQSYVVQLTEFRMKSTPDPNRSVEDIVQSLVQPDSNENLEVIETIRLSALEHHESMVQFGRLATVTVGVSSAGLGRPASRHTQQQQVGTLVRVLATPQEERVLLKLSYEASRLEGEGTEGSRPDTSTVQFDTTLLLEPGKPTLVGGTSSKTGSFLLLSIAE